MRPQATYVSVSQLKTPLKKCKKMKKKKKKKKDNGRITQKPHAHIQTILNKYRSFKMISGKL